MYYAVKGSPPLFFKKGFEMDQASGSYEERSRQTRRNILNESAKLFARRGYHKTTVADISKAIGMTQGALFHQFPNKEAILHAVVDRLARGFDDYRTAINESVNGQTLENVMEEMVRHYRKNPEATICLAALATEFAASDHPILEEIRLAYDRFVNPLAEAFEKDSTCDDPRSAAIAFIGAVQGIATQGLLREEQPPLEDLARAFLKMVRQPALG